MTQNTNEDFPKPGAIIIGTQNMAKAKTFYQKVFGITVDFEDETYISAKCTNGYPLEIEALNEHRFPNWEKNNIGTYKNIEFEVKNIEEFFAKVTQNGGDIVSEEKSRPWGKAGEIKDIDGNTFLILEKP